MLAKGGNMGYKAKRFRIKSFLPGLLMILPSLCGVIVFVVVPFVRAVYYSFTSGMENGAFVGFLNYISLFQSASFATALGNTLRFYLVAFPLIIILPLTFAIVLMPHKRLARLFDGAVYGSLLIPSATLMLFLDLLFSEHGFLSDTIARIFDFSENNLYTTPFSFAILVLLYLFKYGGYNYLLYSVAVIKVPKEFYEEAKINGASKWQMFWYVTLPSILPMVGISVFVSLISSYKVYREAFLVGGYYPHKDIYLIQHFINNNFVNMNYNRLCCVSVIMVFALGVFLALVYSGVVLWRRARK